jgi:hypothetical protein
MRPGDPPSPRPVAQQIASAYCALCGLPLGGERTGEAGDIDRPFNRIAAFGCSFVGDGADVAAEGELERLPLQRSREVAFERRVRNMAGDFLAFDLERNRRRPAALMFPLLDNMASVSAPG